jgi:hypothetical protein
VLVNLSSRTKIELVCAPLKRSVIRYLVVDRPSFSSGVS